MHWNPSGPQEDSSSVQEQGSLFVESHAQLWLQISENLNSFSESWKPCTNLRNELCTVAGMQRWKMLGNAASLGK